MSYHGKRILLVFLGAKGGGVSYSHGLGHWLKHQGAQVSVLASTTVLDPLFDASYAEETFEVDNLTMSGPARMMGAFKGARRAMQSRHGSGAPYDEVIVAMMSPFSDITLPRGLAPKRTLIIHDAVRHPGDWKSQLGSLTRRAAMAWSTDLGAPSTYTAERLHQMYPNRKVSVFPINSLISALPLPVEHGARPGSDDPVRILMLGRLLPYKGLELLPDLVQGLLASKCEKQGLVLERAWTLTIAGAGLPEGLKTNIQTIGQGRLLIDDRWLEWDDYYGLLANHDVLVCCHTEASQSGLIADALAMEMMIVSTNVGGLAEQLANYVRAKAVEPTAKALVTALVDTIANLPRQPE